MIQPAGRGNMTPEANGQTGQKDRLTDSQIGIRQTHSRFQLPW